MSKPFPVQRAFISFFGAEPLYERRLMLDMLACFESDKKFTPMSWGLEERDVKHEYNKKDVLENFDQDEPLTHCLYMKRTRTIKYRSTFWLDDRPGFIIEIDKKTTQRNWIKVFEFADKLASVFKPDFGTVYFSPKFDSYGTSQKEMDLRQMLMSSFLYPAEYYQIGPKGLGIRTYIGDYYRSKFSDNRFDEVPGVAKRLDWGGVRADLLSDVIPQDEDELISAWKENMEVLRSDQVLAECTVSSKGEFNFKRGRNCRIR